MLKLRISLFPIVLSALLVLAAPSGSLRADPPPAAPEYDDPDPDAPPSSDFDIVLQDPDPPTTILINSFTGDYQFITGGAGEGDSGLPQKEPAPNGARPNVGMEGGTAEASRSPSGSLSLTDHPAGQAPDAFQEGGSQPQDKAGKIAEGYMEEKGLHPSSAAGQVVKPYVVGTTVVDGQWSTFPSYQYRYDARDNRTRVIDASGGTTQFGYDAAGGDGTGGGSGGDGNGGGKGDPKAREPAGPPFKVPLEGLGLEGPSPQDLEVEVMSGSRTDYPQGPHRMNPEEYPKAIDEGMEILYGGLIPLPTPGGEGGGAFIPGPDISFPPTGPLPPTGHEPAHLQQGQPGARTIPIELIQMDLTGSSPPLGPVRPSGPTQNFTHKDAPAGGSPPYVLDEGGGRRRTFADPNGTGYVAQEPPGGAGEEPPGGAGDAGGEGAEEGGGPGVEPTEPQFSPPAPISPISIPNVETPPSGPPPAEGQGGAGADGGEGADEGEGGEGSGGAGMDGGEGADEGRGNSPPGTEDPVRRFKYWRYGYWWPIMLPESEGRAAYPDILPDWEEEGGAGADGGEGADDGGGEGTGGAGDAGGEGADGEEPPVSPERAKEQLEHEEQLERKAKEMEDLRNKASSRNQKVREIQIDTQPPIIPEPFSRPEPFTPNSDLNPGVDDTTTIPYDRRDLGADQFFGNGLNLLPPTGSEATASAGEPPQAPGADGPNLDPQLDTGATSIDGALLSSPVSPVVNPGIPSPAPAGPDLTALHNTFHGDQAQALNDFIAQQAQDPTLQNQLQQVQQLEAGHDAFHVVFPPGNPLLPVGQEQQIHDQVHQAQADLQATQNQQAADLAAEQAQQNTDHTQFHQNNNI